jgi:pilus assembly protein CpaB
MTRSGRLLIILGLLLGVLAMVAIVTFLNNSTRAAPPPPPLAKVVVSVQNIPLNTRIVTGAVALGDWPPESVRPDTVLDLDEVIGKLSTTAIVPGQMIVTGMLVDKSSAENTRGSTASYVIPDDKVAVAFPIDNISGVAAALKDGDRVDLIASYDVAASTSPTQTAGSIKRITQLTLQDVEILRVGLWNINPEAGGNQAQTPILTLLVTPQDALVLKFVRASATDVQFALRAAGNHQVFKTQPVIIDYVDQRFNFGGTLTGPR